MRRRLLRGAALLAAALLLAPGPAAGGDGVEAPDPAGRPGVVHTALEAAYPAADSLHDAPVREVRLRYTTAVQRALSAITVVGPDGQVATSPVDTVSGSGSREIGVRFSAPLPSGGYTVEWRTAGPDSHVIRGSYDFQVRRAEPVDTPSGGAPDTAGTQAAAPGEGASPRLSAQSGGTPAVQPWGPGGLTLNWLFLVSVVGMVGVVAFRWRVLGALDAPEHAAVRATLAGRLVRLAWGVGVLAVLVAPVRLGYQASRVAGEDGSVLAAGGAILASTWGSSWMLEIAAAALFLIGLLLAGRPEPGRTPWLLAGVAALLMALVPALVGHSGGAGGLAVVVDAVHVLAAGVWAGGLACLVLAGIPAAASHRDDEGRAPSLPTVVGAFSTLAVGAVAVLVAAGLVSAAQHVALDELLGTAYGRLLSTKVLVALGALALGFYNWRVVRPQLAESPRTRLIRIPSALELTVAAAVLAVTAALIVTATP